MDKELDFTGKTILVTGSGRNIGRAIILEFAARGANVIINTRSNREQAAAVEKEAQALGAKTLVVMGVAGELSGSRGSTNWHGPVCSCARRVPAGSRARRSTSTAVRACSGRLDT